MNGAKTTMAELGGGGERIGGASKQFVGEAAVLVVVVVLEWCGSVIGELAVDEDRDEDDGD